VTRSPTSVTRAGDRRDPARPNQLIAALPKADRNRLLGQCELVHLTLAQVLCEVGDTTRHAYFPSDSFISLLARLDEHHELEVGMAGSEGMFGMPLVLGLERNPLKAIVQGAGRAWRIEACALLLELERCPALHRRMLRYASVLMDQRAVSMACLRYHEIGPRLSRWLLMSQDRAQTDTLPVTQECLAAMLGVRRVGVTTAAGQLQQQGLITYHRGRLTVLDRAALETAACSCYAADLGVYSDTMHAKAPPTSRHRR